jgi:hypothetical protein
MSAIPKKIDLDEVVDSVSTQVESNAEEYKRETSSHQKKSQIDLAELWNPAMNSVWNVIWPFVYGKELRGDSPKCKYDELFLQGGRMSGKSYFASVIIWLALENDPQKNAVIIRKVGSSLRKSCWKQMMKVRKRLELFDW